MISLQGHTPNCAYFYLLRLAIQNLLPLKPSRIGNYFDLGPVCVEFDEGERLCFLNGRGANPAFAIVEAAWMVEGSNEVAPLEAILTNYRRFSDDGHTLNGAYGNRLRSHFGFDQINAALTELKRAPDSRRVVLSLFAADDLGKQSADIPCNTQLILCIEHARLTMTVMNRSNDLWLGVPYNWFTFRVLQQYLANELAIPVGVQRHISTCMHLYEQDIELAKSVVAKNSIAAIHQLETSLRPFDVALILAEVTALSKADFASLQSPTLSKFFQRYHDVRIRSEITDISNAEMEQDSILDIVLVQWVNDRKNSKESLMPLSTLSHNHDTATHLALQRFVYSSDIQSPAVLEKLRIAANNVRPLLPTLLGKELPLGVHISIDAASEIQTSQHIVLELLLGCLDPELYKTNLGENLIHRLREFADQLDIPNMRLVGREMPEEYLRKIFSDVLH